MTHKKSILPMLDPELPPLPPGYKADPAKRREALASLILSISGFRKVFASEGNEESTAATLTQGDKELAVGMGSAFAQFLKQKTGSSTPTVVLGLDTRFTGPLLCELLLYTLLIEGCQIRYLFVVPVPELIAYVESDAAIDGFVYVSASHNPVGYNGVKFGLRAGVLGGQDASALIQQFQILVQNDPAMENLIARLHSLSPSLVRETCTSVDRWKQESEQVYRNFIYRIATGTEDPEEQQAIFHSMRTAIQTRGCGVVIDFNGSARTLGIDREILGEWGITIHELNSAPQQFAHAILPEGTALELCRETLEVVHTQDPRFLFGYVPDCDGDRGNLVYWDPEGAKILEAQKVFALAALSELAFHHWKDRKGAHRSTEDGQRESEQGQSAEIRTQDTALRRAIVVNDPTSLVIDEIAAAFGVRVFRVEVGEANVVGLAGKLILDGWQVPIYGEGSNGGNITYPSKVRDPLATIFSVLKLLFLTDEPSPFQFWCDTQGLKHSPLYGIADILSTIPSFTTLPVSAPEALFPIQCSDLRKFKSAYEQLFWKEWNTRKTYLQAALGIESWEIINYEGMEERIGVGPRFRSGHEKGGMKVLFRNEKKDPVAFLWMRKSGTEPVFRLLVDVKGRERDPFVYLLHWQHALIRAADIKSLQQGEMGVSDWIHRLSELTGMQVEDPRTITLLESIGLPNEEWISLLQPYQTRFPPGSSPYSCYFSFPHRGLQILLSPQKSIETIFLFGIPEEGFTPFQDCLPIDLRFPRTLSELTDVLGEAIEKGNTREGFLSEKEESYDVFRHLDAKIYASYTGENSQIARLTISRYLSNPVIVS